MTGQDDSIYRHSLAYPPFSIACGSMHAMWHADYLTKIVVKGKSSAETKVTEIMTPQSKIMTVPPTNSVISVMELMMKHGFRHVPVVRLSAPPTRASSCIDSLNSLSGCCHFLALRCENQACQATCCMKALQQAVQGWPCRASSSRPACRPKQRKQGKRTNMTCALACTGRRWRVHGHGQHS